MGLHRALHASFTELAPKHGRIAGHGRRFPPRYPGDGGVPVGPTAGGCARHGAAWRVHSLRKWRALQAVEVAAASSSVGHSTTVWGVAAERWAALPGEVQPPCGSGQAHSTTVWKVVDVGRGKVKSRALKACSASSRSTAGVSGEAGRRRFHCNELP